MGKTTSYRDPDYGFVEAVEPLRLMELVSESSLADTEVVDTISSASTGLTLDSDLEPEHDGSPTAGRTLRG